MRKTEKKKGVRSGSDAAPGVVTTTVWSQLGCRSRNQRSVRERRNPQQPPREQPEPNADAQVLLFPRGTRTPPKILFPLRAADRFPCSLRNKTKRPDGATDDGSRRSGGTGATRRRRRADVRLRPTLEGFSFPSFQPRTPRDHRTH